MCVCAAEFKVHAGASLCGREMQFPMHFATNFSLIGFEAWRRCLGCGGTLTEVLPMQAEIWRVLRDETVRDGRLGVLLLNIMVGWPGGQPMHSFLARHGLLGAGPKGRCEAEDASERHAPVQRLERTFVGCHVRMECGRGNWERGQTSFPPFTGRPVGVHSMKSGGHLRVGRK